MAEQNGSAVTLGTEISADTLGLVMVQGTGQSLNQMLQPDLKGINALNLISLIYWTLCRWQDTL